MTSVSRRAALRYLALGGLALGGCDLSRLPDSRKQSWAVLVDLSGTAASDRDFYIRELEQFIGEIARLKPGALVHLVGFSGFARPLASGQAQMLPAGLPQVLDGIRRWPLDPKTDFVAAFGVSYEVLRKHPTEQRLMWLLSDGIHDPNNRWRTRPTFAAPLPKDLPFRAMKEEGFAVHWDSLDEYQLTSWQRAFEEAGLPAILHLRGFLETPRARLQRLPRNIEEASQEGRGA